MRALRVGARRHLGPRAGRAGGRDAGEEALTKACRVLLAPTVNLHRSPLGGRNFECYSEDPLLSGKTAAAFVRGVQSQGVVTTVKHFAGNDAEFERQSINSVIDARTLRELTLVPFELAVREGGALGIMTAYNRLNGPHCSEHHQLITEILRGEWGFEGFVLTDWLSAGSTDGSSAAGLDLEMPGPGAFYGKVLGDAVAAGDVPESELDEHVTHLLQVFDRIGALDDDPDWASTSIDRPEHRVLAREAATAATVLLRERRARLAVRSVARAHARGARSERRTSADDGRRLGQPRAALRDQPARRAARHSSATTSTCASSAASTSTAPPRRCTRRSPSSTSPGRIRAGSPSRAAATATASCSWSIRCRRGRVRTTSRSAPPRPTSPDETGTHTFALVQMGGRGRILLDGEVLLDGVADPPGPGTEFFGFASAEALAPVELEAGKAVEVVVEFSVAPDAFFLRGIKVGHRRPSPARSARPRRRDRGRRRRGRSSWSAPTTTGRRRARTASSMDLPGRQDELVARAVAANPNTVVVVNTGSPVTMDWADDAPAIVQAWFGGQEMGNALADVLFGDAEPGGRLPDHVPGAARAQPVVRQLPRRVRRAALRRGRAHGLPVVRGAPACRPASRSATGSRTRRSRWREPTVAVDGDTVIVSRAGHQHRRPSRHARWCSATSRPRPRDGDASAEGAEGVRQGVARPGRVDHRRAGARRRVRSRTGIRPRAMAATGTSRPVRTSCTSAGRRPT